MAIFKDQQGFMWISTRYGLNRYDGHSYQLYTREKNGLSYNDNIRQISQDPEGNLWLFYSNYNNGVLPDAKSVDAIDIFDPKTEKTTPFDLYFAGKAPFQASAVLLPKIIDPQNRQWICTDKGEIFQYNGSFKKIFQKQGATFQYLSFDGSDKIWAAWGSQLICIDHRTGKVREEIKLPGQIGGIHPGAENSLYLSTLGYQKVDLWQLKDENLIPFSLTRNQQPFQLERRGAYFVYRDRKGYWYSAIDGQLNVFSARGEWLFNYHTLIGKNLTTTFLNWYEDEQYLWLASPTGVIQTSVAENPFKLIHRQEKGYSDCRGITEDEAGNIYFLNNQVYQWSKKTQMCTKQTDIDGAFGLIYVNGLLWAGDYTTKSLGFELNVNTHQIIRYPVLNAKAHLALSLMKTGDPDQLLVGQNNGLAYLDLKNKKVIPFKKYNGFELLKNCEVNHLHKNAAGIWLATNQGIFLMQEKKGIIRYYSISSGDLPFNHIQHIHEDLRGTFWLATKGGGIIQWNPSLDGKKRSKSKQFTTAEGLSNNYTYAIYEDDYGKLWIPSDKGLMWIDKKSLHIRTFLVNDGLPHIEFNHTAHYQAKNGTLYFGGLGGLIAFHPSVFAAELANKTPLKFTNYFLLEGNTEKMTDKSELLQDSDALLLRPSDKFFELHFTLLDFDAPERHRYAYQIAGYSSTWNYINENFIRITNLPYGHYTLKIKGQHGSNGWSEQELSLNLVVQKPFYLRWWFILVAILGIAGAILAMVRSRVKNLEKDRERLEAEVQKRTQQIEQDKQIIASQAEALLQLDQAKTRFFSNIAHEFRTPLTLIIGPLEQVIAEQPPPIILRRRMSGILKNAQHILNLINQLLDTSKLEGGQMTIEVTRGDIVTYTRELIKRFQALAIEKGQRLNFISNQRNWETNFDKDKWDKIIYNLLSNAIKFSRQGGDIQISLMKIHKKQVDFIRLAVKDTGIGIESNQLGQIFNRFYQVNSFAARTQGGTGIGLALIKELVVLQGGEIWVSSEVNKGTSFEILLPVLHNEQVEPLVIGPSVEALPDFPPIIPEPTPTAKPPETRSTEKLELLIIEDNEEMREYIRSCLSGSIYNITEAVNGEEGLQKAQTIIPDLIVSDVMMPKKDGFALTQAIRSNINTSHIPLILLTAKASLNSRLKGLQRGADAYLTKPFSPQELALHIQNLIEIRRMLQQRYQNNNPSVHDIIYQQEDAFIGNLRTYILQNIDESDLNGDRIGKHFTMSRVHLYRKLKALTDHSISEFVMSIRLEKALELVREGKLNVSEITYQTGFSSISHFSRSFKKTFGKPPSEM